MRSRFSIDLVICTYNNAPLLNKTLLAITQLKVPSFVDWGILVVNNNCTDETSRVVAQFINEGAIPVRTIVEGRQGVTAARFCGVSNTNRTWIAFIDDDCILAEDWLEQAALFIDEHPKCGMFGSRIRLQFEKEPAPFVLNFPYAYAGKNHGDTARLMPAVAGAGMVVLKKALEDCGWINNQLLEDRTGNQLISGGDMEIAIRVRALYEVWYNPQCSMNHIIPERRTTKKYLRRMLFGLGASRHHVLALSWGGAYMSWLMYSLAYSVGMLGMGIADTLKEWLGVRKKAGIKIAFSPFLGWNAAIVMMLLMESARRRMILGGAKKRA